MVGTSKSTRSSHGKRFQQIPSYEIIFEAFLRFFPARLKALYQKNKEFNKYYMRLLKNFSQTTIKTTLSL